MTVPRSSFQRQLEMNTFRFLQSGEDARKVCGRGAALGAEHPHEAFRGNARSFFEALKTDGRVDIIAQHSLAGGEVSVDDAFDSLTQ